ncbi:MAG: putative DNA binding domain-containing protein [Bryobacterales bacterium]|nr:putative DNA binding domain-containing protein [Bryobacterales bacterium]
MSRILPVNIQSLLEGSSVESQRIEFKASWDPNTVGRKVLRTVCAFANDYHNLNGGYVVIGVKESGGHAILPPCGIAPTESEAIQQWIRGHCNRLDPVYQPIMSPEVVGGRHVLVVWAPASDTRPHRAPEGDTGQRKYWIRLGAETVDAEQRGMLSPLMDQAAKVPWDDRRAFDASMSDLRESKVREYLHDVRSGLHDLPNLSDVCRRMQITRPVNDHDVPRNVGLLFFSEDPRTWFRGARIEVVQFAGGPGGDVQEERVFTGSLADQVRDCLRYLQGLSATHLTKDRNRPQVRGWVSYPLHAMRESLVNAVYHRSYQPDTPDPTKVYLYPDRMEIISYPGPVPGVEREHLLPDATIPPMPARNQRIGEFLKELRLAEGRLTGIRKVFQALKDNGSPVPKFDFDSNRSYFRATLPAHPEYSAIAALRDAAHLRVLGDDVSAYMRVETAWQANPGSATLATELIRMFAKRGDLDKSEEVYEEFRKHGQVSATPHVANTLVEALFEAGLTRKAERLLDQLSTVAFGQDAIDAAILARRLNDPRRAHRHFERAGEALQADPRALHEFAQTKMDAAQNAHHDGHREANRRLLNEARPLLERVLQLDAPPTRHAWAWRDLARILDWLREPVHGVEEAYGHAIRLLPDEPRFGRELERIRSRQSNTRGRAFQKVRKHQRPQS